MGHNWIDVFIGLAVLYAIGWVMWVGVVDRLLGVTGKRGWKKRRIEKGYVTEPVTRISPDA
jgi:hypothetical protein